MKRTTRSSSGGAESPAKRAKTELPVVIAGAGPVGLALALSLQQAGIDTHVYEMLPKLSDEWRASTLHPPTLEMLDEWEILEESIAGGRKQNKLMYWERESKQLVAEFDYGVLKGETPFAFRLQFPQHELCEIMARRLVALGGRVTFDHKCVGVDDSGETAVGVFEHNGATVRIPGRYVVGTDGSRSAVRKALGLSYAGMTYEDRILLITSDIDFEAIYPGVSGGVSYCFSETEWIAIFLMPDCVRTAFRIRPDEKDEDILDEKLIRDRMERVIGRREFALYNKNLYKVHQRVCETFFRGRILLCGDAAHSNPSTGGFGLNSGVHDAWLLGEALKKVINDGADYEKEVGAWSDTRRDVAKNVVQAHADKNMKDLSATDKDYREKRNKEFRDRAADPAKAKAYMIKTSMLDHRVKPMPTKVKSKKF